MLRFLTAGESHGQALVTILEGIPAGLPLNRELIDRELARRQLGYGRGGRMEIERDKVEILSGVRLGKTMGSPITLLIRNRDWENWKEVMSVEELRPGPVKITRPRPGHSDLAGLLKYDSDDIRSVLERASARETAIRTGVGAVCKVFLAELNISVISHVVNIGGIWGKRSPSGVADSATIDQSPVRCLDDEASKNMVEAIDKAKLEGDTLGGIFEVIAYGVPVGLGSFAQADLRLDGRLAQALMGIPAIKGVEIGVGFSLAGVKGSEAHDEIFYDKKKGFYRRTNRAGGLEAGVTNGQPIVLRAVMKPISTLGRSLRTVDILTKETAEALKERADVCAVPSAAVVGEAVVAVEIACCVSEKFGGDSLGELKENFDAYITRITSR
ncbi:MAG: chorismate synthase [Actinomycetota bacterium]